VFDPCPKIMPAEYPIDDGGQARCFLDDQYLAGDRFKIHLRGARNV
jgi:hypothetical protein